jgi:hypothetical protein
VVEVDATYVVTFGITAVTRSSTPSAINAAIYTSKGRVFEANNLVEFPMNEADEYTLS